MNGMNRRAIANAVAGRFAGLMPAKYADWALAMESECKAIRNPDEANRFAFGGLWTCFKQRSCEMEFRLKIGHYGLIGGQMLLAAFAIVGAVGNWAVHQPTAFVYVALSFAFGICGLVGLLRGTRAMFFSAGTLFFASLIALATVNTPWALGQGWVNMPLYRALAIEGVVIWATLAVVAAALLTWSYRETASR
jgi:hypothetical protein